eukprot:m.11266 g.11266  ORF g.11266 m.11266 type:complete len:301 (-) comp4409_c0_seq1:47-949(-)
MVGRPEKPVGKKQTTKEASGPAPPSDSKSETRMEIPVEKKDIAIIIGTKGATMNKLQDETGTKIQIPPNSDDHYGPIKVKIEGSPDGVKRCAENIRDLCTKRMCQITHGNFVEGTVQVHPDFLPIIIGSKGKNLKGGETIRALQANTETSVVIPPNSSHSKKMQYVKILGSRSGVDRCKAAIKELMRYYHTDIAHPGIQHLEMDIPFGQHHVVVGRRGQTIRGIEGNTGCKINIPRDSSINPNVVIVGTPSGIAAAKRQIENALRKSQEKDEDGYGYDHMYEEDEEEYNNDDYDYSVHIR